MLGSIKIGSVLGITVRVHWLFLPLMGFLLYQNSAHGGGAPDAPSTLLALAWFAVLWGVVFLHELGHSLVARHFGIRVLDITFWPLGGMARMSEIPESSKVEGLIAIAGPLVNFALAALTVPFLVGAHVFAALQPASSPLFYFLVANLLLGTFNLIPAFPMDGGRVLRAFLGRKGDWVGATESAVRVGRVFAVLMVVLGLVTGFDSWMLPLIGIFVWFAGSRELWAVRARHMPINFVGFPPGDPRAVPTFFGAARPVAAETNATNGAAAPSGASTAADSSATSGARRPQDWPGPEALRRPLTDEDIERLERYRGRLER